MSLPANTRHLGLLYGTLLLILTTAVYFIFGTTFIKLPQTTVSMFQTYAYRNADKVATVHPDRRGMPIKIIYWSPWFDIKDWGLQHAIKTTCPALAKTCTFTTDRRQYNDSDVVLVHIRDSYAIPKYRPWFQKWVFVLKESPVYTYRSLSQERWLYNITMTYKLGSDISDVYGECIPIKTNSARAHVKHNYAEDKKHLVAWFVSNCHTQSKREMYVKELAKHIDVHKFGCGGKYSCPVRNRKYCDKVLLNRTYKFYLSFENSLCTEYITEKLYRILTLNVVPVVLGYSNYTDILPPHSFIDVRDFDSPKALAMYLKMLNTNDTKYNMYFAWKDTHTCTTSPAVDPACKLCRYVQRERHRKKMADVVQFWGRKTNCIDAKEFYHGMISV